MANISKLTRLLNGIHKELDLTTSTLVLENISLNLGGSGSATFSGSLTSARTITMPDANVNLGHIASLVTLSGVSGGATDLGTFTGVTIADNSTVKAALQALETAVEAGGSVVFADDTFRVQNASDPTKEIALDASGITTGTTRTIIMPDANVNLGSLTNSNISNSAAIALSKLAALTASRALQSDGSGVISASSVTNTELGYLSGVTSAIQTQLGNKISSSEKGANNGVATLDAGGKIPSSQLPNTVMEYQGTWNASTNSPTLADGAGNTGDVYLVTVAGTQDLGSGNITFSVGDWAVYNGSIWQKSINSNAVASVNGQTGAVTVNAINELTGDVTAGPASGSQSAAATIASGAVTGAKIASNTITNTNISSSAAIAYSKLDLAGSIVNADVATGAAIAYAKLNLTGAILNADISASAAIAYSKLSLTGSIVNADISASAAIAYSKLSLTGAIVNADISASAAIAYSKLNLSASIVNADISASAAIAYSKLNLSNSIVAADLTSASVTNAKVNTDVFDQTTITGGGGSAAAVVSAPLASKTVVVGEAFAANTTFLVRWARTGETAGRVYKADNNAASNDNFYVIGAITVGGSSLSAGNNATLTMLGSRAQGSSDTAFASGDVGKPVFLGTSGAFTVTAPTSTNTAVVRAGIVETTTSMWVQPAVVGVN